MITTIILLFVGAGLLYSGAHRDPAELTLRSERSGLLLSPGNKVKLRGVEVGRVGSVSRSPEGVEIVLEIDRGSMEDIPANVRADIRATTVFGTKYVDLVPPRRHSAPVVEGAVIDAKSVTVEVNTVFTRLHEVLGRVDVTSLNQALGVLAKALDGRGDDVATAAARANDYLTRLEPRLPDLRRALIEVAETSRLGVEISPALLQMLRDVTVTAGTVATHDQALKQLLIDLALLGDTATSVLDIHGDALAELLRGLRVPASTLRVYSEEIPCLMAGLDRARELVGAATGGSDPAFRFLLGFRSELEPYRYPQDLPGRPQGRGPNCHGLPVIQPSQIPVPERGGPR